MLSQISREICFVTSWKQRIKRSYFKTYFFSIWNFDVNQWIMTSWLFRTRGPVNFKNEFNMTEAPSEPREVILFIVPIQQRESLLAKSRRSEIVSDRFRWLQFMAIRQSSQSQRENFRSAYLTISLLVESKIVAITLTALPWYVSTARQLVGGFAGFDFPESIFIFCVVWRSPVADFVQRHVLRHGLSWTLKVGSSIWIVSRVQGRASGNFPDTLGLHCIALHYITLHYIALHCIANNHMCNWISCTPEFLDSSCIRAKIESQSWISLLLTIGTMLGCASQEVTSRIPLFSPFSLQLHPAGTNN
jgi:hypothetical protein